MHVEYTIEDTMFVNLFYICGNNKKKNTKKKGGWKDR